MADKTYKLEFTLSDGSKINAGTFTSPQGPQGVKGDTGPQGPQGEQGPVALRVLLVSKGLRACPSLVRLSPKWSNNLWQSISCRFKCLTAAP